MILVFFGVLPMLVNVSMRVAGRLGARYLPFASQEFINQQYEGYPWLPHYVYSCVEALVAQAHTFGTC